MLEQRLMDLLNAWYDDSDPTLVGPISDIVEELGHGHAAEHIRKDASVFLFLPNDLWGAYIRQHNKLRSLAERFRLYDLRLGVRDSPTKSE